MDGENNGKPIKMDDLRGFSHPYFWKHPYVTYAYPNWLVVFSDFFWYIYGSTKLKPNQDADRIIIFCWYPGAWNEASKFAPENGWLEYHD